MTDRVAISNRALANLGEVEAVIDPDDDTKPAREIRKVWDQARRATLREGKFNFSIERFELSAIVFPLPAPVIKPWQSCFARPEGFLRLVEVVSPCLSSDDYTLERRGIMANTAGPLLVRCVVDVPDSSEWDDAFVSAFAWRLAWEVADPITGDRGRKLDAWNAYQDELASAKGVDAQENPPAPFEDSSWLTARCAG